MIEFETTVRGRGDGRQPAGASTWWPRRSCGRWSPRPSAAGSNRVVVDLAETQFLDSSGLGALIAGLKTTRQAGGDLRIARPERQVHWCSS